jgi:prepilin-type processing-associated H-X9-DG protein
MILDLYRALLIILLTAPIAMGAEKPATASPSPVAALAPADATFILCNDELGDVLTLPVWKVLETDPEAKAVHEALVAAFPGPTMLAVCGTPLQLGDFRVEFAARPGLPEDEFFCKLDTEILPVVGKRMFGQGTGGVTTSGTLRVVRMPGPIPLALFTGVRDGIVFGSTRRADVEAWLEGKELSDRFLQSEDAKRLFGDEPVVSDIWAYLDLRPFLPLMRKAFEDEGFGPLFSALTLDRMEAVGLTLCWSGGSVQSRLALTMAELDEAPPGILNLASRPLTIPAIVPDDFHFFARGAYDSGASEWDRLAVVLDAIDPDIAAEFREESAEFQRDFGFDPYADVLGNCVDECVWAGRFGPRGVEHWMLATALGDPARFETQLEAVAAVYDLPFEAWTHGGILIRKPPSDAGLPVAFACVDNYLVLANDGKVIEQVIDARANGQTVGGSPRFNALRRDLPEQSARTMYFDLARIFQFVAKMGEAEGKHLPPGMADVVTRVAESDATCTLSLVSEPGRLALDMLLNDTLTGDARQAIWHSLAASLSASREQAKRVMSASNIRGITYACVVYANEHKGAWPASLGTLVEEGVCSPRQFSSPYEDDLIPLTASTVDLDGAYLYRPGKGLGPQDVVVSERSLREGGANFGFADGHVEWVTGDRAIELLRTMEQAVR